MRCVLKRIRSSESRYFAASVRWVVMLDPRRHCGPQNERGHRSLVVRLEEDELFGCHFRKVPPLVLWRVAHQVVLTVAFSISQVELEEVFRGRRGNIAHCQGPFLNDVVNGLPDIDEGHTARQEFLRFTSKELLHTQRPGFGCVVTVHKHDWHALRGVGLLCELLSLIYHTADCVVENKYALGADGFLQEVNDLGIEVRPDCFFIFPRLESSLEVVQRKALFVNREFFGKVPAIVYPNSMWIVAWLVNVLGSWSLTKVYLGELWTKMIGVVQRRVHLSIMVRRTISRCCIRQQSFVHRTLRLLPTGRLSISCVIQPHNYSDLILTTYRLFPLLLSPYILVWYIHGECYALKPSPPEDTINLLPIRYACSNLLLHDTITPDAWPGWLVV